MLQKILHKIDGLHFNQEYLCLAAESFEQPLRVYFIKDQQVVKDISKLHCFVGYSPLLFAIPASALDNAHNENIQLAFTQRTFHPNETLRPSDALATLILAKIASAVAGQESINYYEGRSGTHRFVSRFHQYIIQLNNRLYHKKPGNVFLAGNLYKQVQIAYAIPRNISLITVGRENRFNLFPTDLHGAVNDHYIISLRHRGKACQQVMENEKLVVTQVNSSFYKTVYALGKNHMQSLKSNEEFPFGEDVSPRFGLPIPEQALLSRELQLEDSFIRGIHRIMLFKIVSRQQFSQNPATLSHIHNVYATWRHNKALPGNYLFR